MTHTHRFFAAVAAVSALALFAPAPAHAASPDGVRVAQRDGKKHGKRHKWKQMTPEQQATVRAEVERKIDTYVTVELASELGLSNDKALKLSAALKGMREKRHAKRGAVKEEMKTLREMVDGGAPDAALKKQMQAVMAAKAQAKAGKAEELLAATESFLTTQEQAKLLLTTPRIRHDVKRMMRQARHQATGPGDGDRAGKRGRRGR